MTPSSIPLRDIARFSVDGRVWRSFGRFLAVRPGSLLAVPMVLATGDFRSAVDGCPVPWHEVFAAIDTPVGEHAALLQAEALARCNGLLAALFPPHGWRQDSVCLCAGGRPVARVASPDGVVFCWVRDRN